MFNRHRLKLNLCSNFIHLTNTKTYKHLNKIKSNYKLFKQRFKNSTSIVTNITELDNCYFKIKTYLKGNLA